MTTNDKYIEMLVNHDIGDKSPFDMAVSAHSNNNINAPTQDVNLMAFLAQKTTGKMGSGIEPMKQWQKGWDREQNKEMVREFPELY